MEADVYNREVMADKYNNYRFTLILMSITYVNGNQVFRTNVLSYHPFSYHLDTHSFNIIYMFIV